MAVSAAWRPRSRCARLGTTALKVIGDEFKKDMVFAFNIDLFDPKYHDGKTSCVFAETVHITGTGARRLHSYPMTFQELSA